MAGGLLLIAVVAYAAKRLASHGQFAGELWTPFAQSEIIKTIAQGAVATIQAAALAIVFALVAGGLLCAGRISEHSFIRVPAVVVIEFFRAVPLLLLILFLFLGFPQLLGPLWSLVLGLTLYNGSVLAEVFRTGINAVPRGQGEAAYSLGLRKTKVVTNILLPQAVRTMLPTIISQCVVALKDTALGYIITYQELLSKGKAVFNTYFNIIPTVIVIAAVYIALNVAISSIAHRLERRASRASRAKAGPAAALAAEGQAALVALQEMPPSTIDLAAD
jgi:glutamate transport system permease protein